MTSLLLIILFMMLLKPVFNKVVFIIKEENYDIFKETIGKRVEPHVKVEYVFQNNDNIPSKYQGTIKDESKTSRYRSCYTLC